MFGVLKRKNRILGSKIIAVKNISLTLWCGDNLLIPKGATFINRGRPEPYCNYNNSYIELKLDNPLKVGITVTDRIILKRNDKRIETIE